MNNAGEIAELARLVRPHVAIVTAIASAHIENLGSIEAIADAKSEIFSGLEPGGMAIIPEDSRQRDRLVRAARDMPTASSPSGSARTPTSPRCTPCTSDDGGYLITARLLGQRADLSPCRSAASIG